MAIGLSIAIAMAGLTGCRSPGDYRRDADRAAYDIIERAQQKTLHSVEIFTVEPPADTLRRRLLLDQQLPHAGPVSLSSADLEPIPHWPDTGAPVQDSVAIIPSDLKRVTLAEALQIAARNNRDYQTRKEDVFRVALVLDLEANQFRNLLAGDVDIDYEANYSGESNVRGLANTGRLSWQRRLKYGTLLTTQFAVDLVKLLTLDRSSSLGIFADATITMPFLRGAGRHIITEPLTQAEQDVVYALFAFERFRQTLSARVAIEYMAVIQQLDQVSNAADNYRRLTASTRRAQRMADAGRLSQIQVDQALQDDLRARDRWVAARQAYARRLDQFKITLGLPTDADIELDRGELQRLAAMAGLAAAGENETGGFPANKSLTDSEGLPVLADEARGPLEIEMDRAIEIALGNRLDLRTAQGRVYDAQRHAVVAADALRMGLSLYGGGAVGERRRLTSADMPDARLQFDRGVYTAGLGLDLPLERTAERNAWRNSLIALERAVRETQALEDQIKLEVRDSLRAMLQARESYRIQKQAVIVAGRRVESTELFLEAGRAQVRDMLEAQEALVSARNALTAAMVNYRAAEIQLQRDMGVLTVADDGRWVEYQPEEYHE